MVYNSNAVVGIASGLPTASNELGIVVIRYMVKFYGLWEFNNIFISIWFMSFINHVVG